MAEINIEDGRSQTTVSRHRSKGRREVERARAGIEAKRYEIEVNPGKRGIKIALALDPHAKAPRAGAFAKW